MSSNRYDQNITTDWIFFVNTLSTVHPFRLPYALGLLTLVLGMTACTTPTVQPSKPTPTPVAKAREPVIALALGGGGAKGFAHIGAIKVLESHGIKPQIVTGTSAGSFVGSIYASGKTPYQLQEIALSLEESDIRDLTFSKQGFLVGQKLQDYVNTQIGNKFNAPHLKLSLIFY